MLGAKPPAPLQNPARAPDSAWRDRFVRAVFDSDTLALRMLHAHPTALGAHWDAARAQAIARALQAFDFARAQSLIVTRSGLQAPTAVVVQAGIASPNPSNPADARTG
ncbi:MAG: hypothetical protein Fur007_06370 [Rhodoferax sp.]